MLTFLFFFSGLINSDRTKEVDFSELGPERSAEISCTFTAVSLPGKEV